MYMYTYTYRCYVIKHQSSIISVAILAQADKALALRLKLTMPPKRGGLKQRLLYDSSEDEHAALAASSGPSSGSGGASGAASGIRAMGGASGATRRDAAAGSSGASLFSSHAWREPELRPRGLRLRAADEETQHAGAKRKRLPLNESLRRDWGAGKLSSVKVQEYAFGAQSQGAEGIGRMGSGTPQHAQRALIGFSDSHQALPKRVGCTSQPFTAA